MLDHPVLQNFKRISQIPRCSKKEEAIRAYLTGWAKDKGFAHKSDAVGNLVVYVPANSNKPGMPTVILQAHMDMVCEKTPECAHNFDTDPLDLYVEDGWLKARGTSLGADNGVGVAYAMTAAESAAPRPPLELLFTVDEETGLAGALQLGPDMLKGSLMFNMDSEEESTLIIGCASGRRRDITARFEVKPLDAEMRGFELGISNLLGGHSGIDIHKQNANANKLIFGFLNKICCGSGLRLLAYNGGSAMNAIPRDAKAVFAVKTGYADQIPAALQEYTDLVRPAYPQERIEFELAETAAAGNALNDEDTLRILDLMLLMPYGVRRTEPMLPAQTETSCNLGPANLKGGDFAALTFVRSSNDYQGYLLAKQCSVLAQRLGFNVKGRETDTGAWQPNWNSPLLAHCQPLYAQIFGREPEIEVIHAGLECGVIMGKYPGIDALSFGPDQHGAHSPGERLNLASTLRVWDFLQAVLRSYA